MRTLATILFTVAVTAACSSMAPALPQGMTAGRFVTLACADNMQFQTRISEDGKSARVRAMHGSAELDRAADGSFAGEGYTLRLSGDGAISLNYKGKSQGAGCKVRA